MGQRGRLHHHPPGGKGGNLSLEQEAKRMLMERLDDCLKIHADLLDSQDIGSIYELQDLAQLPLLFESGTSFYPGGGRGSAVVSGPVGSCPLVQRGKHPCT